MGRHGFFPGFDFCNFLPLKLVDNFPICLPMILQRCSNYFPMIFVMIVIGHCPIILGEVFGYVAGAIGYHLAMAWRRRQGIRYVSGNAHPIADNTHSTQFKPIQTKSHQFKPIQTNSNQFSPRRSNLNQFTPIQTNYGGNLTFRDNDFPWSFPWLGSGSQRHFLHPAMSG